MSDPDYLALKWGTIKEIGFTHPDVIAAYERYRQSGPRQMSAMMHEDNDDQKLALWNLIDAVVAAGGWIADEWTGKRMTAWEAKRYVADPTHAMLGKRMGGALLRSLFKRGDIK
jgi:hypothetical protein